MALKGKIGKTFGIRGNPGQWLIWLFGLAITGAALTFGGLFIAGLYNQHAGADSGLGKFLPSSTVSGATSLNVNVDKSPQVLETRELGASATVNFGFYTGKWGGVASKTNVSPTFTGLLVKEDADMDGSIVHDDTTGSSISSGISVGDKLKIFSTGASYWFDPFTVNVNKQAIQAPDVEAYALGATTDQVITCYDNKGTTALTADDGTNNTADYNGGSLGAGEEYIYKCSIKNSISDKIKNIAAICTYYCGGEVDDFTLEDSAWSKLSGVPDGVLGDTFYLYDDQNQSTGCSYKHCYKPSSGDYIRLMEWDETELIDFKIKVDATTQTTANGDSYVGWSVFDYGCEKSDAGAMVCDWYHHDDNGDPGEVGLDEAPETTGFRSLDVGVAIEPQ